MENQELLKQTSFSSYEPKKGNRWLVKLGKPFDNINSWTVKLVKRPKLKIRKGKIKWTDIIIKFYDPIGLNSTEDQIWKSLENLKSNNTLINVIVNFLDPIGDVKNSTHYITTLKDIDFGNLDYSTDELVIITMKFKIKK